MLVSQKDKPLKTPFTSKLQRYQKRLQIAETEIKAGNHHMEKYMGDLFFNFLMLIADEKEWLRKQARVSER